ncbi:MAG: H-type lectin domain-containing protein [Rhodobacteraceae bacterium]|nr:H-type lectin domain-containing protein [Paracoccaceae bacterium]
MKQLRNHLIGVDQGTRILFSDFEDGGPMWTETGPRECRTEIRFSRPFKSEPSVQVGISMVDMDNNTNQRADISSENVTARGFEIVFRTWGDSKVARIRADWFAIGEIRGDDEWELY